MLAVLVVLLQKAKPTVKETLSGPYNLVVGLKCHEDGMCSAIGELHMDNHIEFTFNASGCGLDFHIACNNTSSSTTLQNVTVYGLNMTACLAISADKNEASCTVIEGNQVLEIRDLQLDLCSNGGMQIEWGSYQCSALTTTELETTASETSESGTSEPERTTEPPSELETTESETSESGTSEPETTTEPPTTELKTNT
jgi:hypothetical protein